MESVARRVEVKAVFQEFGEVSAVDGAIVTVTTALARVPARRAASCLLAPSVGDRVLVAIEERGDAFVLAVLEQRDPAAATICVEGDLALRSRAGKVTVAADGGIDLVSGAPIRVASSSVEVDAVEGRIAAQALTVIGGLVRAELDRVKVLATSVDAVLERLGQRVKRSFRTVEEIDQVRARHLDYAASGNAHLRGENTLVTAHDLVKVNAGQVHIG